MWASDFSIVRIAVRGATKIKPDQDHNLAGTALIFSAQKINPTSTDVQQKLLAFIQGLERHTE